LRKLPSRPRNLPPTRPPIPTPEGIPLVGLTGGIGAGKSTALAALERLGCAVLSTDAVVHEIQSDPVHIAALVERFGGAVESEGALNRAELANAAFGDDEGRKWLENYMWPLVGARIAEWVSSLDRQVPKPRLGVVEVPLLFESGMDQGFDSTISVLVDEAVRAERASARGHAALDERAARQLSQAEKAQKAGWVVPNDGSEAELQQALSDVVDQIAG